MPQLLDQPSEILHNVFQHVRPWDLANLSKTCRTLNQFIRNDRLLWKTHYLLKFDPPVSKMRGSEPDWQQEMHELLRLQKLFESENTDVKKANITFAANMIFDLLRDSVVQPEDSLNTCFLDDHFRDSHNVDSFVCRSSLFAKAGPDSRTPADTFEERQLSAKLHVLYGVSVEPPKRFVRPVHPYARAKIYDLRRYNQGNMWGPFLDDGSEEVDWERMEAVMVVIGYNLRAFTERMSGRVGPFWQDAWLGTAEGSFISPPKEDMGEPSAGLDLPLDMQDPYGVTGTWMRIVCFLDYTDLYALNFESEPIPLSEDRDPVETQEAIRFITLKMRVSHIEPPGPHDGQDLPVVHFTGTSRSMYMSWDPNANSRISGTVRQTRAGAVRWTSFSIYHGQERWRSEGVQIGGLRSRRGVLGTWFDKDYDVHGPAGPTAFWKLSDEITNDKPQAHHEGIQVVFL